MFITKKKLERMIDEAKCAESNRIHEEHYRREEMNSIWREIKDLRRDVDKINRELHQEKKDQETSEAHNIKCSNY